VLERVLEQLIKGIVEYPDDVCIQTVHYASSDKIKIKVNDSDIPRLVGKRGKTVNALRNVISSLAEGKRIILSID
jgi:predicted RNA-binding protein YlqC (UPF0109 family)